MQLGRHLDIKGKGDVPLERAVNCDADGDLLYDERDLDDRRYIRANRYPVQRAQGVILCDGSIIRTFDGARRTRCLRLKKINSQSKPK